MGLESRNTYPGLCVVILGKVFQEELTFKLLPVCLALPISSPLKSPNDCQTSGAKCSLVYCLGLSLLSNSSGLRMESQWP